MRHLAIQAAALFAVAVSVVANQVTITATAAGHACDEVTVALRQVRRAADLEAAPLLTRRFVIGEPAILELDRGYWSLDIESNDWWHPRRFLAVADSPLEVRLELAPAAFVAGHVVMTDGSAPPPEVSVAFASTNDAGASGEAACGLAEGNAFRCRLPSGVFDLRLRAKGCVTQFFWRMSLEATKPRDLGMLRLERGSAIIGRLVLGRGVAAQMKQVRLLAVPTNAAQGEAKLPPLAGVVEEKGLFHVDGVAPGQYTLTATVKSGASARPVDVVVYPGLTAEVRDPLRLDVPRQLRVVLAPFLSPSGGPWYVEVVRAEGPSSVATVNASYATDRGEWSAERLHSGEYEIRIGPDGRENWMTQPVTIDAADVSMAVAIPSRAVRGVVTLGDRPIAARVVFIDDRGTEVTLHADADGRFVGSLPRPELSRWRVKILSDDPAVVRTIPIDLPANDSELSIHLPKTVISGIVVDEEDAPVEHALVRLTGPTEEQTGRLEDVETAADGTFTLFGVNAEVSYRIWASAFLKESLPVSVQVRDDGVSLPLRLVVRDVQVLSGRVMSDFGAVAGATVVVSATDVTQPFSEVSETDAAGEFRAQLPAGAQEVNVFVGAPGFALRFFHTRNQAGRTLTIRVAQNGGSLIVSTPAAGRRPMIFHGGADEAADSLFGWPVRQDGERLIIASLDPGPYALCMVATDEFAAARSGARTAAMRCRTGFLPPFGELDLAR